MSSARREEQVGRGRKRDKGEVSVRRSVWRDAARETYRLIPRGRGAPVALRYARAWKREMVLDVSP